MAKLSIFGSLTTIQIMIHSLIHGKKVGTDMCGNTYYRGKPRKGSQRERRWVLYKGTPEASAVPPEYHGWLHHQTDVFPAAQNAARRPWQKPHRPNPTGTPARHLPSGHPDKGGRRAASTGDYQSWQPPQ